MKRLLTISMILLLTTLSGCYSCQTWNKMWGTGPVEPGCENKFFFDKDCRPMAKPKPAAKPIAKPVAKPAPKAVDTSQCGPSSVTQSYPCESCEVIVLNKTMPSEVLLDSPFEYTIKVKNVTNMTVHDVLVTESVPESLIVRNAIPAAKKEGNKITWKMGSFAPKETKIITLYAMATSIDCLKTCAAVIYVIPSCASIQVVQPKLELVINAPAEVILCDPIPVTYTVTNSGTGTLENVKLEDNLSDGLKTAKGNSRLSFVIDKLSAGQSRQFSTTLNASKTGKYVSKAIAFSPSGLKAEAQSSTIVRRAVLAITKNGPARRYLGRSVDYKITVTNNGDVATEHLVVEDELPTGVKFVSASNGGKASAGKVKWNLNPLAAGKSINLTVTMMPVEVGTITNTVIATATCADGVKASVKTVVAGIPAVLLEVIDIEDPVEIGGHTTYVITATNQGSAIDTNISIVCKLEKNEQYVSSTGATKSTSAGDTITFTPLASLAPKAQATWRVVIKAVEPGDVRFKTILNTDQLTRPVVENEATRIYE